jgi:Ran GTPase-activating protein (RanGAP) involved in mRNA processing and transport
MNTTLVQLSLNYCGLEAEAADPLIEIVIFTESALTILSLQGNFLKKDGIVRLCDGLPIAKKLEKIILADNQFGEEDEVLEALSKVIIKNKTLKDYNLQYNAIREKGNFKANT